MLSDCTFQYNNISFVIQNNLSTHRLKGRKIEIYQNSKKEMRVLLEGKEIKVKQLYKCMGIQELTRKEVIIKGARGCKSKPSTHPWKQGPIFSYEKAVKAKIREEMQKVV